jgi:hypothetical protein
MVDIRRRGWEAGQKNEVLNLEAWMGELAHLSTRSNTGVREDGRGTVVDMGDCVCRDTGMGGHTAIRSEALEDIGEEQEAAGDYC